MEVAFTAMTKNTGISVKKIKPVADLVRGKNVEAALQALGFMVSPAAAQVANVVKSAAASAEDEETSRPSDLHIVAIHASEVTRIKRFRPRSRGKVGRVTRNISRIIVVVDEEERDLG